MTWTYNPGSTDPKDIVRFLVGDTNALKPELQDEEIAILSSMFPGGNAYRIAAASARALASKYATAVNSSIESVSVSMGDISSKYLKLADDLLSQAGIIDGSNPNIGAGVYGAIVTGATNSDYDLAASDQDRLLPMFTEGQWDNPPGLGYR